MLLSATPIMIRCLHSLIEFTLHLQEAGLSGNIAFNAAPNLKPESQTFQAKALKPLCTLNSKPQPQKRIHPDPKPYCKDLNPRP